ncbi:hypothetical protein CFP56_000557 [Quercus suber]|uniref:Uncharacterized protein n=1 Tax=Quercus suber TaxID=58331 RepID=A0AAW0IPN3_QUESU
MGIGPTVSQFIFWFKHDYLWMLEHCLNQLMLNSGCLRLLLKSAATRKNVLLFKSYKFQYFDSCCSKI